MYYDQCIGGDYSNMMFDDTDSMGNPDSIFGLGKNRQLKKADKKAAKAVKKLAKGNFKAAERKQKKADKIYTKVAQQQAVAKDLIKKKDDINRNQQLLNATDPVYTESMNVEPGQIGSNAGATTMNAGQAALQTMGGSGGDIGTDETTAIHSASDEPTGWLANEKELAGVTVTSKKTNWLLIAVIAVVAIAGIILLMKNKK